MGETDVQYELARHNMVAQQLRSRGIRSQRVLRAMESIPRERFVPPEADDLAYDDRPVPIGFGQTISQPYIVALMTQELDVQPEDRVLDVGSGSGYQTAVLAHLARQVFAIERIPELALRAQGVLKSLAIENVTLVTGDGTLGLPEHAPYDRILCGAGGPEVPPAWIDQLAEGGRIVVPTGPIEHQMLIALEKRSGRMIRRELCPVCFVRLIGQQGWPG